MTKETVKVVSSFIDPDTNLKWETIDYLDHPSGDGTYLTGRLIHAVCRPESCATKHVCGILDLGVVL